MKNNNTRKKVLIVFGTRPEAIKMVPFIREFEKHIDSFEVKICVTAQHRELLDQVLNLFDIVPDYDLDIMQENQTLHELTSRIILEVTKVLEDISFDIVLVHGDTTTAMASSLAAYYKQVDIGHVEAGLRSFDLYSPWPEEGNRKIITQLAKYHFVPTKYSFNNLIKENIKKNNICITGNTIIDILSQSTKFIKNNNLSFKLNTAEDKKIIFVTVHRREKSPNTILHIMNALKIIINNFNNVKIYILISQNSKFNILSEEIKSIKNIFIVKSLDYYNIIMLIKKAFFIVTDSGSIQEEGSYFGKPILLLRNSTDRQEVLNENVKMVGTNTKSIVNEIELLLINKAKYNSLCKKSTIYGEGNTSKKIIKFLGARLV